ERNGESWDQVLGVRRLLGGERLTLVLEPPGDQRFEHRREVTALLGQLVPDLAAPGLLVSLDNPLLLELAQPDRQPLRRHVREQSPQVAEATRPGQQVADDQQRPALADGLERARREAEVTVTRAHLSSA